MYLVLGWVDITTDWNQSRYVKTRIEIHGRYRYRYIRHRGCSTTDSADRLQKFISKKRSADSIRAPSRFVLASITPPPPPQQLHHTTTPTAATPNHKRLKVTPIEAINSGAGSGAGGALQSGSGGGSTPAVKKLRFPKSVVKPMAVYVRPTPPPDKPKPKPTAKPEVKSVGTGSAAGATGAGAAAGGGGASVGPKLEPSVLVSGSFGPNNESYRYYTRHSEQYLFVPAAPLIWRNPSTIRQQMRNRWNTGTTVEEKVRDHWAV